MHQLSDPTTQRVVVHTQLAAFGLFLKQRAMRIVSQQILLRGMCTSETRTHTGESSCLTGEGGHASISGSLAQSAALLLLPTSLQAGSIACTLDSAAGTMLHTQSTAHTLFCTLAPGVTRCVDSFGCRSVMLW